MACQRALLLVLLVVLLAAAVQAVPSRWPPQETRPADEEVGSPSPSPSPSPAPASSPSLTPPPPPPTAIPNATSPCLSIPSQFPLRKGTASLGWSDRTALAGAGGGKDLACGFGWLSEYAQVRFAAVNQKLHGACGRCIAVTCSVPVICAGATAAVLPVVLVDDCGHCGEADVLLSWLAFREVTGLSQGAGIPVEWFFVPCGPFVTGSVWMDLLPGGDAYYQQITFSNFADPLVAVSMNGQPLQPADWGRWTWHNGGQPLEKVAPLNVTLVGSTGAVRAATLAELGRVQVDLGVKF